MNTLWCFYNKTYQQIHLNKDSFRGITIGPKIHDTVTVLNFPFSGGSLTITKNEDQELEVIQNGITIGQLSLNNSFHFTDKEQTLSLILTPQQENDKTYYIGYEKEYTFAAADRHAQVIHHSTNGFVAETESFVLIKARDRWMISPKSDHIYLNGHKIDGLTPFEVGDLLFWPFMSLKLIEKDLLQISSLEKFTSELPLAARPVSEMSKKYPNYRRTPRMVFELPTDKVTLSFPSQEGENPNKGLWLIVMPPLLMMIVMGIVSIVQPRGIFIIVSMVMFATTLVTSSVQYFKERGNFKKRKIKRRKVYNQYLDNKRKELQELAETQKNVLHYHFPSFEQMKYYTEQLSDRIWERTLDSHDFLQIRIGTGKRPASYTLSLNSGDMANREVDELLEQSQQMEKVYKEVRDVPITVDLSNGAMGLIGKESIVKNELHQLIGQLAFFHSYHDVRFIFVFNEKDYSKWEWLKWLPHFQLPNSHAKGLIYNEQTRDQLLSSVYELIRERDLETVSEKDKVRFSPHLIFIILDQQLLAEHVLLEYLEGEYSHLGLSVIFAAETKESLTDNIHTLIRYINDSEGDILIEEKKAVQVPFKLDVHKQEGNETYSRMLKTLNHLVGMTNSIPNSVSLLELFGAREVEDLPIEHNWETRESSKSLAVPIGLKGKEDIVQLNLHEKAHGPHGLLAGTTGSGKSEFLQTYILSLAVNFHPHEVAFLLIDYKGGGMAQPFKDMPHLLGTITNIEGSRNFTARALASIKSELKRRQRLFDQYQVNHINEYTNLYKRGESKEPLPHLFLISDEFAELKSEEPEFIKELVSAARIGRSLGVHLILATQKPGGVIDDQIWSNARFKIALKVQDAADSREILKNADASSITVTGRGYLQVGNNEVYELFQSAWSGAPYLEETIEVEDEVALVTDLGLVPLSGVSASDQNKKEAEAEIDVIVDRIEELQLKMGIKKLNSPWLPPLNNRLINQNKDNEDDYEVYLGMVDEPEKQSQTPYIYRVMDDGNVGIFGSSGYGKSHSVMTLLLSMASKLSPEEMHYYLFDFGNGALLPLRQLPHTADYFLMDEERKIEKFMRFLKDEIADRKQKFQKSEVSSIKMYNALNQEKLPLMFVTIDNFDLVKEEMQDLEMQMTQFARDGQSLGIYMIFTATRINAIRQSLMNNLKTKIVHYLMDQSESYMVLGKVPFSPEPIPGRAIIKREEAYFSQIYLPAQGEDDYELLDHIKKDIQLIGEKYASSIKPQPVPMLPSELTMVNFTQYTKGQQSAGILPIGLDEEFVKPVHMNFLKNKHCMIVGQTQKGKTNALRVMLNTILLQETEKIGMFDSIDRGLSNYAAEEKVDYLETKEHLTAWLDQVQEIVTQRENEYLNAITQGTIQNQTFTPIYFVIDGYSRFIQNTDSMLQDRLSKFMKNYSHIGFNVIVSGNNNEITKGFDMFTTEVKQIRQALVLMKKSEQSIYTLPYNRKEEDIHAGYGYYVENGKETKIQIPLSVIERKIYT
ncbi:type VII secretion protein EssC [Fictibacillus barbaricus]|uniref:S-DNA-T family DNA segregation ATPase FtsK/SpoIIIE n=1 Tax=Fictibacillus barbaricus TaxID=182136 RepID=A0ABU1U4P2_9BACL|nr:type VII secretion protein EssC [Fictibacillus barbaricus]MDR7074429.1 S-DNA-T family DNA segregation ATPase FtsK/SpoIIIE [Fictibacillus barbaricus]